MIDAAIADSTPPSLAPHGALPALCLPDRDVLHAAFGIPSHQLLDEAGSFSDTRLIASFRLRLGELQAICDRILSLVADTPPSVFIAASGARDLVTSVSPLTTLAAARDIRARLLDAFTNDPARAASILAEIKDERDQEMTSFLRMRDRLQRASSGPTERERAIAVLEAYKHMVEGHTRRWAWTLLQLAGADGERPTVGKLGERVEARLAALGTRIRIALLPAVRNAEAHEDFDFDDDSGLLIVGTSTFTADDIHDALVELDVLQRGWILGRVAAFSDQPDLAIAVDTSSSATSRFSSLAQARERFAHAGQPVRSFTRDRDLLRVEIDDLRAEACNPCFVALTQSAMILSGVSRFVVRIPARDEPVIDIPATVLRAAYPVLERAVTTLPHVPQSTFLPCLAWCRQSCEPPEEVIRATAWLTLNDAQHAIDDWQSGLITRRMFAAQLRVAHAASNVTLDILPGGIETEPLERASRIVDRLASIVTSGRRGPVFDLLVDRVLPARDELGAGPSILPAFDPTSVDDYTNRHEVD